MPTVDAQPATVSPINTLYIMYMISKKANMLVITPSHKPSTRGFVENEIMEPLAKLIILDRGYLETPASLLPAAYGMVTDGKPSHSTAPRKNRSTSFSWRS